MLGPTQPISDYRDTDIAVIVTVKWAGRTWYLSSQEITGDDFHALPGLLDIPDVDDEISLSSVDAGVTVPIGVVLPIVVADYVGAGHDLADMTAEIAWVWHRRGVMAHPWSARDVRAEGDLDDPQYGDPSMPTGWVGASVVDSPYRTVRPIVRRTWAVTSTTWPSAPDDSMDERYPLVIGAPDPQVTGEGPPAIVVEVSGTDAQTVVVSIGWCLATFCTIVDGDGASVTLPIEYRSDGLGQTCAVCDVSGSGATIDLTSTFTSAWDADPALTPFGSTSPIHVAAYLLSLGGADIDLPEWVRTGALLGLSVAGWVDDPDTQGWEVARDILQGLPVSTRRDRDGWSPVLIDPALASSLYEHTWTDSGPWRRASSWQGTGDTRITRAEVTSPASETVAGASTVPDAPLPHAWARHLPRQSESSVTSSWSWSETTDRRAVGWSLRIGALGWVAAAWGVPAPWARARSGDFVYLSDLNRYVQIQRRTVKDGIVDYTTIAPAGDY